LQWNIEAKNNWKVEFQNQLHYILLNYGTHRRFSNRMFAGFRYWFTNLCNSFLLLLALPKSIIIFFILFPLYISVCYAIITLVVFIQPQWVGTRSPASSGYFGLWRHCAVASVMTEMSTTSEFICRGRLDDFSSIINPAFRVATIFVGIAALVAILSVFGLILFICAPARQAYFIIAMMQALAGNHSIFSFIHPLHCIVKVIQWMLKMMGGSRQ